MKLYNQAVTIHRVLYLLFYGMVVISCTGNSKDMELHNKINKILVSDMSAKDGITALLALEKEHPKNVRLQVEIGKLYLLFNEIDRAGIYLETSETLYKKNKKMVGDKTRYVMYSSLALYRYQKEQYEQALKYVKQALKVNVNDSSTITVIHARVLAKLGNKRESIKMFRKIWEISKDQLGIEVIQEYLLLELEYQNWDRMISLFDYVEYRFGQVRSLGTLETFVYNADDKELEKIFSYIKEMEYRKFTGELDLPQIKRNLSVMPKEHLSDDGLLMVDVIFDFYKGLYDDAEKKLSTLHVETSYTYYHYFSLVIRLLAGEGNRELFSEYLSDDFEKRFSNTSGYYYYLWQGMKKGDGEYIFAVVKEVLETCIVLSPNTIYAEESRVELGRLVGLNKTDSHLVLTRSELDQLYYAIADASAPLSTILSPVLKVIMLPSNVYTTLAVNFLQTMIENFPQITQYLEQNKNIFDKRTKSRLFQLGIDI